MILKEILKEKILVLDGALGTMIQKKGYSETDFRGREFINHPVSISGFNDILNLTKPTAIKEIHLKYLSAGANIISTNTFNSNAISMRDYGLEKLEGLVTRINRIGGELAKEAIKEYVNSNQEGIFFVAGSIGPTNRSCTMSPDITDPLKRNILYKDLFNAYEEQIEGLTQGGVDILLFETFFDTLNLKAGLDAANKIMEKRGIKLPIMVSATISDNSGRILSGQNIEAFLTSVNHYANVEVVGLNCSFGPDRMISYIEKISEINPHFTSCHPNAGLPDESGCYDISSQEFASLIKSLLKERKINIIGGCCGTTPDYISKLAEIVKLYNPLKPIKEDKALRLCGLDMLTVKDKDFLIIGERCNVAGSSKFLRLIKEGALEEAAEIAKVQIRKGAKVIDINMDDAMINAEHEMVRFIRYILAEPEIAKVPFMIDSSKWNVIESALRNIQGKGIVNSLSLKEGEEIFIERAKRVKELGFALVVMAFDENGQAETYERKIEICKRSYDLLIEKCGFNPSDIIFDVNIMTIATGIKEHARYAMDFIEAVKWIKLNLPLAKTSGGVSNLSFAFRGKNRIREYMHSVFLHHAKQAGLDMAIINPSQNIGYEDIPIDIKEVIEDIIFDKDLDAVEKLIEYANEDSSTNKKEAVIRQKKSDTNISIHDKLIEDLVKGDLHLIDTHLTLALEECDDPVKIIEGPLLEGMKKVGVFFGEGKMFLPQVVKTARTMKRAVEILTPHIEQSRKDLLGKKAGKVLIATVKGDVHDIGKNIVSTVLSCNNYEVIDLGIMVLGEKIVETALKEQPDIICLSGLITPSLGEMTEVVKLLSSAGIKVPVMVGGAATSLLHTVLKIDPFYKGTVLHMSDASQNPIIASVLMNRESREIYLKETHKRYEEIRCKESSKGDLMSYNEVLEIVKKEDRNNFLGKSPKIEIGRPHFLDIALKEIIPNINWKMFFLAWKIQGKYLEDFPFSCEPEEQEKWLLSQTLHEKDKAEEALQLYLEARAILNEIDESGLFDGKGVIRFEKAHGDEKNIYVGEKIMPMLRQQRKDSNFLSCSDLLGEKDNYLGFFAVTAGNYIWKLAKTYEEKGDSYKSLILQTLADRLAEASSEWLNKYVNERISKVTLRPAWGYPMLPDQTMILETEALLPYEKIGISLTENGAMLPPSSISGLYFSKNEAKYFVLGEIGEDQIRDYAKRRGVTEEFVKKVLRQL